MTSVDLMQEIEDLRELQETLQELYQLTEEIIEKMAQKQYQLEIDWNDSQ